MKDYDLTIYIMMNPAAPEGTPPRRISHWYGNY